MTLQSFRQVDVLQVIQNVLDDTSPQLKEKGITPSFHAPQHVEVLGDQSLIYSIFRNLVDNAIGTVASSYRSQNIKNL